MNQESISKLEICYDGGGRVENDVGVGCTLCKAGQQKKSGGGTLIYYILDLQSTLKVSYPLPEALNENTTLSEPISPF